MTIGTRRGVRSTFGVATISELDLNNIAPGVLVRVLTYSGSQYWITRVFGLAFDKEMTADTIRGLSVTSSSKMRPQFEPFSPANTVGDRIIRVGKQWNYHKVGHQFIGVNTSAIMTIDIDG